MQMRLHEAYWINGLPILGNFCANTLDDLKLACDNGFNFIAYAPPEMLDPEKPMGRFALDNGIKAMHSITGHVHGRPRLPRGIDARETTIPIDSGRAPAPGPGLVVIEDEHVRYREATETALVGCERRAEGTEAAPHPMGIILFWPEPVVKDLAAVTSSPNLWGYWALDDTPGNAVSAMRGLTKVVHANDPGHHPVCGGYSSPTTMHNFGPGACDIMGLYWYPVLAWVYDRQMTSFDTQAILADARKRVSGIPFLGVYQAFWGGDWNKKGPLTEHEIREQAEDFVREGASGLMAFAILHKEKESDAFGGWNLDAEMTRAVQKINAEVRASCALEVPPERPEMAAARILPAGFHKHAKDIPGVPPAWYIATPFDNGDTPGLDAVLPPDRGIDLGATYAGKGGATIRWEITPTHTGSFALLELYGRMPNVKNISGFAVCTATNPVERRAQLRFGSEGDTLVRINGREVWRHTGTRGVHMDSDVTTVTLPAGKIEIVVKAYAAHGLWGLFLRFAEADGRPLTGLTFSPTA